MRMNRKGLHRERWCCSGGCGQWFKVTRDTVTHELREVLRYAEPLALDLAAGKPITRSLCTGQAVLKERANEARLAPRTTGARSTGPDPNFPLATAGVAPTPSGTGSVLPTRK